MGPEVEVGASANRTNCSVSFRLWENRIGTGCIIIFLRSEIPFFSPSLTRLSLIFFTVGAKEEVFLGSIQECSNKEISAHPISFPAVGPTSLSKNNSYSLCDFSALVMSRSRTMFDQRSDHLSSALHNGRHFTSETHPSRFCAFQSGIPQRFGSIPIIYISQKVQIHR